MEGERGEREQEGEKGGMCGRGVSKIIDQPPPPSANLCLTRVPSQAQNPNWFPALIIQLSPLHQRTALQGSSDGLVLCTIDKND